MQQAGRQLPRSDHTAAVKYNQPLSANTVIRGRQQFNVLPYMTNKALLISIDDDEGGVALLSINGVEIGAMNCLGYGICNTPYPTIGSWFEPTFSCLFDDDLDVDWHTVFEGNPDQEKRLHRIGVWSYRALGRIVEIEEDSGPALADCGGCLIPLPITMYDPDYIGAYVGFEISRLNVWRK